MMLPDLWKLSKDETNWVKAEGRTYPKRKDDYWHKRLPQLTQPQYGYKDIEI